MNKIPLRKFVPAIFWFLIVMVLLFTPGSDLPKVDNWFNIPFFDKYVHVGIFTILAFLCKPSLAIGASWASSGLRQGAHGFSGAA